MKTYREKIKDNISKQYDSNGNITHLRNSDGFEIWWEYDDNGNLVYSKDSYGFEEWREYDDNGKLIDVKISEEVD